MVENTNRDMILGIWQVVTQKGMRVEFVGVIVIIPHNNS